MKAVLFVFVVLLVAGCATDAPSEPAVSLQANNSYEKSSEPQANTLTENSAEVNATEVITSETIYPPEPIFDFNYTDENGTLRVFFFHSPGCSACQDTYPILSELEGKFPDVSFINYSLATPDGSKAYVKFAELHNLSTQKQMVPQVLVNGTIITDRFNIEEKLGPLLENLTK